MWLAILGLYCVHVPQAAAQAGKLLPVDHGVRQPVFFSFRAGLLRALARRDSLRARRVRLPGSDRLRGPDTLRA